ncbi:hypothetical protein PV327_005391 [Microctonus hyperodae]|uniref:2',5'-phosphodiesterase 12 n=1 Tax=Microctonus hyperodae TaxID=165561 RepID=A0AA39G2P5_MICHY|nr:hypothetical protein PV327_005391 [Microctonus hyperodae]
MIKSVLLQSWKKSSITSLFPHINQNFLVRYKNTKLITKMNEAFLHHSDDQETFDFTFRYTNQELKVDRQFNLSRQKSENVESFLRRVDTNLNKILVKKIKKRMKKNSTEEKMEKTIDNVESGNIVLMKDDSIVELNESWEKLLDNPSQLSMIIFGVPYNIKFNAPWVLRMKLPKSILAGFPIYPSEFESLFTDKSKSEFNWYRYDMINNKRSWIRIGEGYIYIPSNEDIGKIIKLECVPRNYQHEGPSIEIESEYHVEAGPGTCPFESRHLFTQTKLSGNDFRVTSYNILANIYADSDYSRGVLFPYCPPYALAIDYRKLLIIKELIGYNSDIICLQEVDKKIYENDMKPALSSLNYDGIFNTKGEMSEGLAILYNKIRFELLDTKIEMMKENVNSNEIFKNVWEKITNEDARNRFLNRNTSVLIVTLRSLENPKEILVIGNTHLYFHPDADHIRLLQAYYALTACQNTAAKIREKHPEHNVTLMLCGDFNSTPVDGVYELLTKKRIPEDHKDWNSNQSEKVDGVSLVHDLSIASACGTPEYTNFTVEFADCLDYIYYESDKLNVTQVVPMPSKDELSLHGAIPSVVFPSDHIAICADMKWICK